MMTSACGAGWEPTTILQMSGESPAGEFPAHRQILTESWNRVVAVPISPSWQGENGSADL